MKDSKIRTIIGLVVLYVAVLLNWQWIWGILFLIWIIPDLFSGLTYFMGPIERKSHPILYWLIVISWIWMSIYMIAGSFVPQLNAQNYQITQAIEQNGIYKESAGKVLKEKGTKDLTKKLNYEQLAKKDAIKAEIVAQDTLQYKLYHQEKINYFVGMSSTFNYNDPELEKHTNEFWNYFYANDISQLISNIVDERIYLIYTQMDNQGNYKATIAYRTEHAQNIYEGLEGITIPPTKFAVFESRQKEPENFISKTWEKIYNSELYSTKDYSMEVYELNKEYGIEKSEIRLAIK